MEDLNLIKLVGEELEKLDGNDKTLHFAASYALCVYSEMLDKDADVPSSLCILKAMIGAFSTGLIKEYIDAGKDPTKIKIIFEKIAPLLHYLYKEYKNEGLDTYAHESDLLADMAGIGTYVVNQSLRSLDWKTEDENKNRNT